MPITSLLCIKPQVRFQATLDIVTATSFCIDPLFHEHHLDFRVFLDGLCRLRRLRRLRRRGRGRRGPRSNLKARQGLLVFVFVLREDVTRF